MSPGILAIDQGTTGTTTVVYDAQGRPQAKAYREFTQHYPQAGWVEHDAQEIWQTVVDTVSEVCQQYPGTIAALGITNQRETTVLWDRHSGQPLHHAIVWQCRRTAAYCEALQPQAALIRQRTGLPLDAYFSASKIRWLLDNAAREDGQELLVGTIDSWLIWKLTAGEVHATDYSNASRTLLFDIHRRAWCPELLELFGIPASLLPSVRRSTDDYGTVRSIDAIKGVAITGVAGDQQAALFGQACFSPGQMKNTYGTGCFAMMHTGEQAVSSDNGLITTLAVDADGGPAYALEGAVFIGGAAVQWLRDELGLIATAAESESLALSVDDSNGVYLVPAFVGLGAPHWDMAARGALVGLTRGTNRRHVVRATLESMAYQSAEVLALMAQECGTPCEALAVDGGAVANNFLLQFQADLLDKPVLRPAVIESTSRGAAYLAGLQVGIWPDASHLRALNVIERRFQPQLSQARRGELMAGWQHAVRQCRAR